jgi:hypothetical protein
MGLHVQVIHIHVDAMESMQYSEDREADSRQARVITGLPIAIQNM